MKPIFAGMDGWLCPAEFVFRMPISGFGKTYVEPGYNLEKLIAKCLENL